MGASWIHTGYAQQIHFGAGAIERVSELIAMMGVKRVMLVSTKGRVASDDGRQLAARIGSHLGVIFDEVEPHVPAPLVQRAVQVARREGIDAIVSFGGGSCADAGKAVNFFFEAEQGTPSSTFTDRPLLPHISLPTTYSGAELTPFFGITDPHTRQKSGAGGATCAPIAAVYDPEVTLSTPRKASAETGMNALAHCVEILWSMTASPEARAIAIAGARRIHVALPWVVEDPDDLAGRTAMLEGAVLGGRCLQNGSMGIHHGLSQLVGGRTGIPHGLANAIILPHAIRYNADAVPDAIAAIADALGTGSSGAADEVEALVRRIGLPTRLSDAGVCEEDIEAVARLSQGNGNVRANPKPVTEDDARQLLEDAF